MRDVRPRRNAILTPPIVGAGTAGESTALGLVGLWRVGEAAGAFLATSGVSTLIGCEGAPVPYWIATAATAGIDGEWLKLFDASGNEIGRLQRG